MPFQLSTPTFIYRVDHSFSLNAPVFSFVHSFIQKYLLSALEETKLN